MTETTVEKISRNHFGTIICTIFVAALIAIIAKDFYLLFHQETSTTIWTQILHGVQLIGAFIALLWLGLLMIVPSVTMLGPSFKKTCAYTVTLLIVAAMEIIPRLLTTGFMRWFWTILGALVLVIVLLQMLAFSLDPHSSSIFASFRPFRIDILTVIRLSNDASPKNNV